MNHINKIVEVANPMYGICKLDVDRVIALVPEKNMLLFERAYWVLNDKDFNKVSEVWHKLKA